VTRAVVFDLCDTIVDRDRDASIAYDEPLVARPGDAVSLLRLV
jgi:hypothetical protein